MIRHIALRTPGELTHKINPKLGSLLCTPSGGGGGGSLSCNAYVCTCNMPYVSGPPDMANNIGSGLGPSIHEPQGIPIKTTLTAYTRDAN